MKYDLKETETTDAETLDHVMTVVSAMIETSRDADGPQRQKVGWDAARKYLKDYITELLEQQTK